MNMKFVKIISSCLTVAGVVISLATNALSDKILNDKIENKISEALTKNK